MPFYEVRAADGSWQRVMDDWQAQCAEFEETLDHYAVASLPMLREVAEKPQAKCWVYATELDDNVGCLCQLNIASIPNYDSPVLRVRFMTVSPRYDFGDLDVSEYGKMLVVTVMGALNASFENATKATHIKFHLQSPADRAFFAALGASLDQAKVFESVKLAGSWLYVSKKS